MQNQEWMASIKAKWAEALQQYHTRQKFALNEENGHRSCTLVNMGAVALRLGRQVLNFDPVNQLFIGDDAANALVDQPMRGPWKI